MVTRRGPGVRARGLGAELRELRDGTRLGTRAVAAQLGWSASTLNRIENGKRNASSEEVAALLVVYGVTGAERDNLLHQAREVDQQGWWEVTRASSLPPQLTALIGFEATATRLTNVAVMLVPGLLQTAEYIRAVMHSVGVPENLIEARVAARLGRQAVLSRPDPPAYLAVVDESTLRRRIGPPALMADQLGRILKDSLRPNVTVQVLPTELGAHPALEGSFVLLDFAKARSIVHLEHKRAALFIDEPKDVEPFKQAVVRLTELALEPDKSAELLARIMAEYERE